MLSLPTGSTTSVVQSHHKITVESLCCETNEVDRTYGSTALPRSDRALTQVTRHELERSRTTVNRPSPGFVYPQQLGGLAFPTRLFHLSHSDNTRHYGCAYAATDSTSVDILPPTRVAEDVSITDIDTTLHHDRSRSMVVPPVTDVPTISGGGDVLRIHHEADARVRRTEQTASDNSFQRIPRPARSAYTEEQKFFIMYCRVVQELSWPEIEDKFADFFHLRTKDGLTSVYYRIRKDWDLKEVLKTSPSSKDDRETVKEKAGYFQEEFLGKIRYVG
jgi:hypothetical protein